jgi:hypothetical protein
MRGVFILCPFLVLGWMCRNARSPPRNSRGDRESSVRDGAGIALPGIPSSACYRAGIWASCPRPSELVDSFGNTVGHCTPPFPRPIQCPWTGRARAISQTQWEQSRSTEGSRHRDGDSRASKTAHGRFPWPCRPLLPSRCARLWQERRIRVSPRRHDGPGDIP